MLTIRYIPGVLLTLSLTALCPLSGCQNDGDQYSDESEEIVGEKDSEVAAESASDAWNSAWVYKANGKLKYKTDNEGNRVPDFGYVGYRYGATPPGTATVPNKKWLSPSGGDDTAKIQAAVDAVGAMQKNGQTGFRGAVMLKAGTYTTSSPIYVPYDGVVIRGAGSSTIVKSTRSGKDVAVFVLGVKSGGNNQWKKEITGTRRTIKDDEITIGTRKFEVSDGSNFKAGDLVVVEHDPKQAWFDAVEHGGVDKDTPWENDGDFSMRLIRTVKSINTGGGKTIFEVDAPFYMNLKKAYADLSIYKFNPSADHDKVYHELGIENMTIDIQASGEEDEDHTQSGVRFHGVIDGWARNVTALHFAESGFEITRSSRITVKSSHANEPRSLITGGRRYSFKADTGAQEILFDTCSASEGRHAFVGNGGTSSSGIVTVDSTLEMNIASSEGHMRWVTGMLFDRTEVKSVKWKYTHNGFAAVNHFDSGSSHGWSLANGVLWNIKAVEGTVNVIEKPPTAQSFAIGVDHVTDVSPGDGAAVIEKSGQGATMSISSLYRAQHDEASGQ